MRSNKREKLNFFLWTNWMDVLTWVNLSIHPSGATDILFQNKVTMERLSPQTIILFVSSSAGTFVTTGAWKILHKKEVSHKSDIMVNKPFCNSSLWNSASRWRCTTAVRLFNLQYCAELFSHPYLFKVILEKNKQFSEISKFVCLFTNILLLIKSLKRHLT